MCVGRSKKIIASVRLKFHMHVINKLLFHSSPWFAESRLGVHMGAKLGPFILEGEEQNSTK